MSDVAHALHRDPGGASAPDTRDYIVANALDRMAGGADDNSAQANHLVPDAARCLTTSNQRIDAETETFVTSITLASDPISAEDLAQPQTKRNGDPGCVSYAQGVRRLTPTETERLQGFPDGWTALPGAPDSRRYAAMGDAVTVPVAKWIGLRLRGHEAEQRGAIAPPEREGHQQ